MEKKIKLYVADEIGTRELEIDGAIVVGMDVTGESGVTPEQRDVILAEHDLTELVGTIGTRWVVMDEPALGRRVLDLTQDGDAAYFVGFMIGGKEFGAESLAWVSKTLVDVAECAEAEAGICYMPPDTSCDEMCELNDCLRALAFAVNRLPEEQR